LASKDRVVFRWKNVTERCGVGTVFYLDNDVSGMALDLILRFVYNEMRLSIFTKKFTMRHHKRAMIVINKIWNYVKQIIYSSTSRSHEIGKV
jgi:hypothetical protein